MILDGLILLGICFLGEVIEGLSWGDKGGAGALVILPGIIPCWFPLLVESVQKNYESDYIS